MLDSSHDPTLQPVKSRSQIFNEMVYLQKLDMLIQRLMFSGKLRPEDAERLKNDPRSLLSEEMASLLQSNTDRDMWRQIRAALTPTEAPVRTLKRGTTNPKRKSQNPQGKRRADMEAATASCERASESDTTPTSPLSVGSTEEAIVGECEPLGVDADVTNEEGETNSPLEPSENVPEQSEQQEHEHHHIAATSPAPMDPDSVLPDFQSHATPRTVLSPPTDIQDALQTELEVSSEESPATTTPPVLSHSPTQPSHSPTEPSHSCHAMQKPDSLSAQSQSGEALPQYDSPQPHTPPQKQAMLPPLPKTATTADQQLPSSPEYNHEPQQHHTTSAHDEQVLFLPQSANALKAVREYQSSIARADAQRLKDARAGYVRDPDGNTGLLSMFSSRYMTRCVEEQPPQGLQ